MLTNDFDAEYGNYSGGVINVVTKSGSNQFHGSAFEFLRNTDLDSRNFFSPERGFYKQNQFGGTIGGPIKRNKLFFFIDYRGTRNSQGINTGLIQVPTPPERQGNFSGNASSLNGMISGHSAGCTTSGANARVFPGAIIPQSVWASPATHLLQYIPLPNDGPNTFTTGANAEILQYDKASTRIDFEAGRWGHSSPPAILEETWTIIVCECKVSRGPRTGGNGPGSRNSAKRKTYISFGRRQKCPEEKSCYKND